MKTGRLFWKFFFFFWLAQLVTSIGVGVGMWLWHQRHEPGIAGPPPPIVADALRRPPPFDPARPPPHARHRHQPLILPPLMPLLAGSVVSLLFAALLAWYFSRPINSLKQAFGAAAGGQLDTRIGNTMGRRQDELADLGADFDRMAERLQGLVDGQRRLLHDVSHELRSPLARLQAAADLLRQQPERSGEFVGRIERDTARMDRLVGELLTLARVDAGTAGSLDQEVDLHELIADIADDAMVEAEPRNCGIDVSVPAALVTIGNHELLGRAIENVVRNAVRHSPDGGNIAISAAPRADEIVIAVADQGTGVRPGDLERIFEPFFRSATADSYAGYGLGLAITRRIVQAHGGSVAAANGNSGGLVVTMRLPARPRSD